MKYSDYKKQNRNDSSGDKISYDEYKKNYRSKVKYDIDEDEISNLERDYAIFRKAATQEYSKVGYNDANKKSEYYSKMASGLRKRAEKVNAYLNRNKDSIDEEKRKSITNYVNSLIFDTGDIANNYSDKAKYFSKWDSEESYNSWVTNNENRTKYDAMSVDDLNAEKETRSKTKDANKATIAKLQAEKATLEKENAKYGRGSGFAQKYNANLKRIQEINKEIKELGETDSSVLYYDDDGTAMTVDNLIRVKSTEDTLKNIESTPEAKVTYDALRSNKEDIDTIDKAIQTISMGNANGETYVGTDALVNEEDKKRAEYITEKYGIDFSKNLGVLYEDLVALRDKKCPGFHLCKPGVFLGGAGLLQQMG